MARARNPAKHVVFDWIPGSRLTARPGMTGFGDKLRGRPDWGKGRPKPKRRSNTSGNGSRSRMLLVTGGAGFIGSNVVAALNEAGRTDVVVNDALGTDQKWRNLAKRQLADVGAPADLLRWLAGRPR